MGWILLLLMFISRVICNEQVQSNKPQQAASEQNIHVNVPNFIKNLPDFNQLLKDYRPEYVEAPTERLPQQIDRLLSSHLYQVRENYKRIGNAVESALNLGKLRQLPSLFSMSLDPTGQKPKLNVDSPLASFSLNSKTDSTASPNEEFVTSTEVPFTEYLEDLVKATTDKSVQEQENRILSQRMGLLPKESLESSEESDSDESFEIHPQTLPTYQELILNEEDPYSYYNPDQTSSVPQYTSPPADAKSVVGSKYVMDVLSRPHETSESYYEQEEFSGDENIDLQQVVNRYKIDNLNYAHHAEKRHSHQDPLAFRYGHYNAEDHLNEDSSERVVDQRDMEIAFLNVDEEEMLRLDRSKRVVLAFTLTGVPIKIFVDRHLEDPIHHLHGALCELGLTMYIPVHSSLVREPAGSEILYVGAGSGDMVTPAISLQVPDITNLKDNLERFLEPRLESRVGKQCRSKILSDALRKSIFDETSFTDALQEAYERNPDRVMIDISNFLRHSHETNLLDELLSTETPH